LLKRHATWVVMTGMSFALLEGCLAASFVLSIIILADAEER